MINMVQDEGLSFLHMACSSAHPSIVKLAIEAGADVNLRTKIEYVSSSPSNCILID